MALNAHYRYSAAVEYAQSQWESVSKRAHYKMQEDGSVVLVDPNHHETSHVEIQKIDPARLCPFEVQPTDPPQPAAHHGAQITTNKLEKSRMSPFEPSSSSVSAAHPSVPIGKKLDPFFLSFFEQPKVDPFNKDALSLITSVNQFDQQTKIMVNDIPVNSDQLDWLWPFDHQSSDAAANQPKPSTIVSDVKIEATVIDQLDFSCFNLPPVVINKEQKKMDLADFDAMVADLNAQEQAITKPQLIDAMIIGLKLRKYIANPMSSIATSSSTTDEQATDDLANYDEMVAALIEQELPFSKSQLIDVFCASSKLRKHIKTVDSNILLSQPGNETIIASADIQPIASVATHQPQPSSIDSDIKTEATVIDQLDIACFNLPSVVINNEQQKIELADFDAMVENLNALGEESTKISFPVPVSRNYNNGYNYRKQRQKERQEQIKIEQLLANMDAYIASPNDEEMAVEPVIVNQPSLAAEAPIESSSLTSNCASEGTQQHPVIIWLSNDDDANGEVHDEEEQQVTMEPILTDSDKKFRRKKTRRCNKKMNAVEPSGAVPVTIALPELVTAVDAPAQLVAEQLTDVQLAFMAECENEFVDRYTDNDQEYVELRKKQISHPPIYSFQHHLLEPSVSAAQPKVASAQTKKNYMVPTAASTAKQTSKFVATPVNQGPAWNSSTKIDPKAYQKLPSVPRGYIMQRQQKAIEVGRRSSPALP